MKRILEIDGWKARLLFSAAHLIVDHPSCGQLHGHTYAVSIRVGGDLDKQGFIVDLQKIKQHVKNILITLDHRMLLPTSEAVVKKKGSYHISFSKKTYQLPESDCVQLPIPTVSVEYLSEYILLTLLKQYTVPRHVREVAVRVDEGPGQGAWIQKEL